MKEARVVKRRFISGAGRRKTLCLGLLLALSLVAQPAQAKSNEDLLATLERVVNLTGEYMDLLDQPDPDVVLLGSTAQEVTGYQLSSWSALQQADQKKQKLEPDEFGTHLYILSLSSAVTAGLSWTWFSDTDVARDIEKKGQWKTATELGIEEVGQFLTEAGFVLFSATAEKVKE